MPSEYMPWQGEEGNEHAVGQRELRLPPHLQMYGNERLLRDALLAVKMLRWSLRPKSSNPLVAMENERTVRNQAIIMAHKAKMLEHFASEETIQRCEAAAQEMFGIYIRKEQAKQAQKYVSPKKHTARMSEAEFKYTVKKRKVKEKKKWDNL